MEQKVNIIVWNDKQICKFSSPSPWMVEEVAVYQFITIILFQRLHCETGNLFKNYLKCITLFGFSDFLYRTLTGIYVVQSKNAVCAIII